MNMIIGIIVTAAALWVTTVLVPGIQIESSLTSFLIVAANLRAHQCIRQTRNQVTVVASHNLTLGLFAFVINALDAYAHGLDRRQRDVHRGQWDVRIFLLR